MTVIRDARTKTGISQTEMARLLHVPKRTYEDWEAGRRNPTKGYEYYAELVAAIGALTQENRKELLEHGIDESLILYSYRRQIAKKKSGLSDIEWDCAHSVIPYTVTLELSAHGWAKLAQSIVKRMM